MGTEIATGRAFLDMLGVFAEVEINLRRKCQWKGIKAGKARGGCKGSNPTIDVTELWHLRDEKEPGPAAIARRLGIGRASVYRMLGKANTAGVAAGRRHPAYSAAGVLDVG